MIDLEKILNIQLYPEWNGVELTPDQLAELLGDQYNVLRHISFFNDCKIPNGSFIYCNSVLRPGIVLSAIKTEVWYRNFNEPSIQTNYVIRWVDRAKSKNYVEIVSGYHYLKSFNLHAQSLQNQMAKMSKNWKDLEKLKAEL